MTTYCSKLMNHGVRHDMRVVADGNVVVYYSKRFNSDVVPDLCIRMYIRQRTNHTYALGLFTIWATRSASVTSLSPMKIVPFISQIPRLIGLESSILRRSVSPGTTFCLNLQFSILRK